MKCPFAAGDFPDGHTVYEWLQDVEDKPVAGVQEEINRWSEQVQVFLHLFIYKSTYWLRHSVDLHLHFCFFLNREAISILKHLRNFEAIEDGLEQAETWY